jgi:hypothetical protein
MSAVMIIGTAALLRLAIYYGYPSLVEHAGGDVSRAVAAFSAYDVVVLGGGLELDPGGVDPGLDQERRKLSAIVRGLHATPRKPQIFGYIDLGSSQNLSVPEITRRIELWKRAGVDGVFFDEAGADFHVTAARRRAAVKAVHERGLSAFLNAFNPDDLFAGDLPAANGKPTLEQIGPRDLLLIESFAVRIGVPEPPQRSAARVTAALRWRQKTGVRLFGVTTAGRTQADAALLQDAWRRAAELGLDGMGWGEPDFSADSRLPSRPVPEKPQSTQRPQ